MRVGIIDRALRDGVTQLIVFHSTDHSNDRASLAFYEGGTVDDPPAKDAAARPIAFREILIDDTDTLIPVIVSLLEKTSLPQRHAHRLPVGAGAPGGVMRLDRLPRLRHMAFDNDRVVVSIAGHWNGGVDAGKYHARLRSQFVEQPLNEGKSLRRLPIVVPRQHKLSRQDMVWLKAGRYRQHALEASPEQGRADQQHKGQRHLPDGERVAQSLDRETRSAAAGFGLQHEGELAPQVEPHHGHGERDAGESRCGKRHQDHTSGQSDIRTERQLVDSKHGEHPNTHSACGQSEDAPRQGELDCFEQRKASDMPPACAQRLAHREFFGASAGADEHEIGQVHPANQE